MSLFGLFKKRKNNDEYTQTKKPVESTGKFSGEMSQKERDRLWDQKLAREQALARKEDIDEENRQKAHERKEAIKKGGKTLVKHTGHAIEGLGIIANKTADIEVKAAKKIYKKGKPAAKTFVKDLTKAGKVAAKGLGDWADRVVEEDKPKKRKTTTRRVIKKKPTTKIKVTVKRKAVKRTTTKRPVRKVTKRRTIKRKRR